jgi:predicted  nucleic acid-binding Zn-ribbon protein
MDEKKNMEILLEIQNTLGTVVATTQGIQEDIKELKEKDVRQSDALEKAYAKAKARQDSIRDDLQHQIDSDHQLITDIKSSIDSLTLTISGIIEESKNNAERIIKESLENYDTKLEKMSDKISALENEKKNKVYSRWEKISDKLFLLIIAIVFAAVFKWFNFTPPALPV